MPLIHANNLYYPPMPNPIVLRSDYKQQPWSGDTSLLFRIASQAKLHFENIPSKVAVGKEIPPNEFELPPLVASKIARTRYKIVAPMEPVEFDADEFPL